MTAQPTPDAARPLRLLHAFSSFEVGGAQSRAVSIANAMGPSAAHHIFAMDGRFDAAQLLDRDISYTLHAQAVEKSAGLSPRNLTAFRTRIKALRPDLLLTYNWGAIEWALANRFAPLAPHLHFEDGFGPEEADGPLRRRIILRRLALGSNSTVVTPSETLRRIAVDMWGFRADQVRRIPNGVDLDAPDAAHDFRRNREEIVVGSVGALRPEKNYGRLLRAVAAARTHAPLRLVLVGDGPERPRLEDEAARLQLSDHVTFTGRIAPAAPALAGFDIFALSSDTEQAPLSLLEAMAAGLPVIATDVGDIARMVPAAARDFVMPLSDEPAFADALVRLAGDAALRARLGAAGRAEVAAHFTRQAMVAAYASLYRAAVRDA